MILTDAPCPHRFILSLSLLLARMTSRHRRNRAAADDDEPPPPPQGVSAAAQAAPGDLPPRPDAQPVPEHEPVAASVTIPMPLEPPRRSPRPLEPLPPVLDATGARPDPVGARFTSSSSDKVSNFIIFSIILYIHIYCLLVVMFGFVMSDDLS
jgi:hypothetical protein